MDAVKLHFEITIDAEATEFDGAQLAIFRDAIAGAVRQHLSHDFELHSRWTIEARSTTHASDGTKPRTRIKESR